MKRRYDKKEKLCYGGIASGFAILMAALVVAWYSAFPISDGDYFWHVALGRDILRTGSIVHVDHLSWLAEEQGLVYTDHS